MRLEAEAVLGVLALCQSGKVDLIASDALVFETDANPDAVRRDFAVQAIAKAAQFVALNDEIKTRAQSYTVAGGIVDTFRFVNQFTTGHGDYTKERETLFANLTLDDIIAAIEKKREANNRGS